MLKSTIFTPLCFVLGLAFCPALALSQDGPSQTLESTPSADSETDVQAPQEVDIQPTARDEEIGERLRWILQATE
jgi:hypothetical protein